MARLPGRRREGARPFGLMFPGFPTDPSQGESEWRPPGHFINIGAKLR
jgi:hypothetical protein